MPPLPLRSFGDFQARFPSRGYLGSSGLPIVVWRSGNPSDSGNCAESAATRLANPVEPKRPRDRLQVGCRDGADRFGVAKLADGDDAVQLAEDGRQAPWRAGIDIHLQHAGAHAPICYVPPAANHGVLSLIRRPVWGVQVLDPVALV
jgi:hypothetical protein